MPDESNLILRAEIKEFVCCPYCEKMFEPDSEKQGFFFTDCRNCKKTIQIVRPENSRAHCPFPEITESVCL